MEELSYEVELKIWADALDRAEKMLSDLLIFSGGKDCKMVRDSRSQVQKWENKIKELNIRHGKTIKL